MQSAAAWQETGTCCRKSSRLRITLTILRYCGLGIPLSFCSPFRLRPWLRASLRRAAGGSPGRSSPARGDGRKPARFVSSHSARGSLAMTWSGKKETKVARVAFSLVRTLLLSGVRDELNSCLQGMEEARGSPYQRSVKKPSYLLRRLGESACTTLPGRQARRRSLR